MRWRSLTNFSFCPLVLLLCTPDPGAGAADGAFSRTGSLHGAGPEASVRAGLPRTPRHADAVWLRREPHAGSGPAGGVWTHALTDGPGWQFPWYGGDGGHGAPPCEHDEAEDDERQQAHETAAATEAAGTAGEDTEERNSAMLAYDVKSKLKTFFFSRAYG